MTLARRIRRASTTSARAWSRLRMPRALEMLDATLRRIEQGEIDGIEALDDLLARGTDACARTGASRPRCAWRG